ncbi:MULTISPECIES: hypothetical protein [unclassified Halorhabdus]|uniref:hypothetical protein n=1 Tax=unclassified Halorhabdus TaxID=2621901 RepID=UPI0023DAED4E|nr:MULTISPECIES: hypothetical protein [unclassified Halorhabdus]WEL18100.1 Proteasome lid subunit RPN8/RPN11, contains Jab1/MPN domain metalloenzyme (JAMM) motif [Halorhabdus sp. SVX81]WEL21982.1 Proteasome lid subunit RPN8/RPN11, contains Jab1/MPN domain metalloenzyme (JAMM) motif [Halorhabdus sp. BNX81]
MNPDADPIYATEGLIDVLLEQAAERAPDPVTISVSVTPAGDFGALDLPAETPVFTHLYLPDAGSSLNFVFGVDLGTPAGQTQGRFVSHPDGRLELTQADDFHAVVFVAVPPWDRDAIAVFDRDSTPRELRLLDAEPPEERFGE